MEVGADARDVSYHGEAVLGQVVRRPDAGEHEQLRRADGPARDDDLRGVQALEPAVVRELDPDAARAVEEQPSGVRADEHSQVGLLGHVAEVGGGRALANAVLDAVLHVGDAVLPRPVVVGVERHAAFLRGGHDCLVDGVGLVLRGDGDGPRVRGGVAALDALEDRAHVVPRPAVGAEVSPGVVVGRCAAHPDHRVQAARAAEYPPARPREAAIAGVSLRDRLEGPVLLGEPQLVQAPGVVDGGVDVGAAGLQQHHARSVVGESACGDRSRRARAHDDDVGIAHARNLTAESLPRRLARRFADPAASVRLAAGTRLRYGVNPGTGLPAPGDSGRKPAISRRSRTTASLPSRQRARNEVRHTTRRAASNHPRPRRVRAGRDPRRTSPRDRGPDDRRGALLAPGQRHGDQRRRARPRRAHPRGRSDERGLRPGRRAPRRPASADERREPRRHQPGLPSGRHGHRAAGRRRPGRELQPGAGAVLGRDGRPRGARAWPQRHARGRRQPRARPAQRAQLRVPVRGPAAQRRARRRGDRRDPGRGRDLDHQAPLAELQRDQPPLARRAHRARPRTASPTCSRSRSPSSAGSPARS